MNSSDAPIEDFCIKDFLEACEFDEKLQTTPKDDWDLTPVSGVMQGTRIQLNMFASSNQTLVYFTNKYPPQIAAQHMGRYADALRSCSFFDRVFARTLPNGHSCVGVTRLNLTGIPSYESGASIGFRPFSNSPHTSINVTSFPHSR